MPNSKIQPQPRTTLVSVLGWMMLVVGLLITLAITLNLLLMVLASQGEGLDLVSLEGMPPISVWLLENIMVLMILMIISGAATATAGLGVVWRREWGRQLCIVLLALSIVWALISGAIGLMGMDDMLGPDAGTMGPLMLVFNLGSVLFTVVLHGWLIWKLRTMKIRGEFVESPSESF